MDPNPSKTVLWYRLILCSLFYVFIIIPATAPCGFIPPTPKQIAESRVYLPTDQRAKRQVSSQNIRIHVTFDKTINDLESGMRDWMENVMMTAVTYWENALKVKYSSSRIFLPRACESRSYIINIDTNSSRERFCLNKCANVTKCGDMIVPEHHLQGCRRYINETKRIETGVNVTSGVADTDFLLYVSSNATSRCKTSIAYASYCHMEAGYDRPIAGFVNLCPPDMSDHRTRFNLAVATVKHEMLHALGFSESLFAFYRDEDGNPLTERGQSSLPSKTRPNGDYVYGNNTVLVKQRQWKYKTGIWNRTIHLFVRPNVRREVRQHFNCSHIEGAELEDQGSEGTRLTHWEKRIFEHELMTGIYTQNPIVSRVTLALMEDTGWYVANYSHAEELDWGKNLGCDFITQSCYSWITDRTERNEETYPFCTSLLDSDNLLKSRCSYRRDSVILCNKQTFESIIPPQYQISNDSKSGGNVILADYCPYYQEISWTKDGEFLRGSNCLLRDNQPAASSNFAAELYGTESGCFDQLNPFKISQCSQTFTPTTYGSGCYHYSCEDGLTLYIGAVKFKCYKEGQILTIQVASEKSLHEGYLVCPKCSDLCTTCPPEREPIITDLQSKPDVPCSSIIFHNNLILTLTLILLYFIH